MGLSTITAGSEVPAAALLSGIFPLLDVVTSEWMELVTETQRLEEEKAQLAGISLDDFEPSPDVLERVGTYEDFDDYWNTFREGMEAFALIRTQERNWHASRRGVVQ